MIFICKYLDGKWLTMPFKLPYSTQHYGAWNWAVDAGYKLLSATLFGSTEEASSIRPHFLNWIRLVEVLLFVSVLRAELRQYITKSRSCFRCCESCFLFWFTFVLNFWISLFDQVFAYYWSLDMFLNQNYIIHVSVFNFWKPFPIVSGASGITLVYRSLYQFHWRKLDDPRK